MTDEILKLIIHRVNQCTISWDELVERKKMMSPFQRLVFDELTRSR